MTDYSELKRLAAAIESCTSIHGKDEAAWMRRTTGEAVDELIDEVDELKTENERQAEQFKEWQASHHANYCNAVDERDQLKAENEALRKDAERYRWLRDSSESIHQFYLSTPIWFTGVRFSKDNVDNTIDAAMSKEG